MANISVAGARKFPRPALFRMGRMERDEALWFYALASPWAIGFLVFALGPILASFYLSFTQYDMANPPVWLGLSNYRNMVQDPLIWQSLKVTAIWVFGGLPLRLMVAFFFALLLNQNLPGSGIFRTIFYLPSVVSGVAIALVWMWLLQPQFGILNYFLQFGRPAWPALAGQPCVGAARLYRHEPVEHRRHDCHLPGRPTGHPLGTLRSRQD